MNFYFQRKRVYNFKAKQKVSSVDCIEEDEEVTMNNNIYTNESLTMYSRSLLKETRKKCQFTGYTVNGKVRARKSEEDEFIIIERMHDVSNLS